MAKILYGVMGNTYGHLMRSLAITARLPEHEFYFVGGGRVAEALGSAYPLLEVPVLRTVHRRGQVSVSAVLGQIAGRLRDMPPVTGKIRKLIEQWKPDIALCDREFFLPLACRGAGLKCLSIDHSHILKACHYPVPAAQWLSWSLAMANDYALFNFTRQHLIVSFFHPPLRNRPWDKDELLPPVLRTAVSAIPAGSAMNGDHVLVYQTSATFKPLLEPLSRLGRPVIIYGFGAADRQGNLTFKPFDDKAILEDLAGCAYAVVNGGHNLICEALYFKKPVLCFPIAKLFEQFINAWHVRSLGYGDFSTSPRPDDAIFRQFEERLDGYRQNLSAVEIDGTARVVARMREIIENR